MTSPRNQAVETVETDSCITCNLNKFYMSLFCATPLFFGSELDPRLLTRPRTGALEAWLQRQKGFWKGWVELPCGN